MGEKKFNFFSLIQLDYLILIWHFEKAVGLTDIVNPKFISGNKIIPSFRVPSGRHI